MIALKNSGHLFTMSMADDYRLQQTCLVRNNPVYTSYEFKILTRDKSMQDMKWGNHQLIAIFFLSVFLNHSMWY